MAQRCPLCLWALAPVRAPALGPPLATVLGRGGVLSKWDRLQGACEPSFVRCEALAILSLESHDWIL